MVGQKYKKIAPESLYLKLGSGAMSTKEQIQNNCTLSHEDLIATKTTANLKVEVPSVQPAALMPYIKNKSELIIPGNCPEKYKWWKDGQSVFETFS